MSALAFCAMLWTTQHTNEGTLALLRANDRLMGTRTSGLDDAAKAVAVARRSTLQACPKEPPRHDQ